ncbi:MAG: hypothetical protein ASARMPRED_008140 [Alectoria sarmentosa]|nr:MAG: hypothetical protein ASARMPRED_008140 [Alectoria sarmentosa]
MSSPASLKRPYADTGLDDGYRRDQGTPTLSAATQVPASSQACSPSPSPANLLIPTSTAASNTSTITGQGSSAAIAEKSNKRSKLTFAEQEAGRIEKQFKEQQKAEEKAKREGEKTKKEEEKARKDEEKRVKDAEKEDRKRVKEEQAMVREAERQRKLDEKQKAEEEKNKKARSQLRLNSFFVQPSMPVGTPSASPTRDTASPPSSRRSSIAEIHAMEASRERSRSMSVTPQKARLPYHDRQFPPFFLQSHTVLAPHNRFSRDKKGLEYAQAKIDEGLGQGVGTVGPFNVYDLLHLSPDSSQRFPRIHAVKDIIAKIHGSVRKPIDLTDSHFKKAPQRPIDLLKTVPMKYLKFFEDNRPPYTGTFTKPQDRRAMSRLSRNPISRELPSTDYDYDSEAEWEEPEEGEDLESEGEEDVGEDEEENEMEGFLDDEENDLVKKRPLLGHLEPFCSGICWEDLEHEDSKLANLDVLDLSLFKLDVLMGKTSITRPSTKADDIENPQLPIDPYSTSYWKPNIPTNVVNSSSHVHGTLMEPPRIPLNPINRQNTFLSSSVAMAGMKGPSLNATTSLKPPKGAKRLIPSELMEEFKKAVNGNELTKLGLIEVLKKQFPEQPKAAIRDTLDTFAERMGAKEAEKRWMLKSVS